MGFLRDRARDGAADSELTFQAEPFVSLFISFKTRDQKTQSSLQYQSVEGWRDAVFLLSKTRSLEILAWPVHKEAVSHSG